MSESIDGDRRFDVIGVSSAASSEHGTMEVVRGADSGDLEIDVTPPPTVSGGSWIARARIDGDALDDLFVISGLQVLAYRGTSTGFVLISSVSTTVPFAAIFNWLSIVELDGDGRDDLAKTYGDELQRRHRRRRPRTGLRTSDSGH